MAKKQRTPRTVLDAPVLTPVQPVAHRGPNRAARRHVTDRRSGRTWVVPRHLRQPATNEPHRKRESED